MAGLFETDPLLDFALLGPLRVARAGAPVELGGRQQRAVLARLLMADGSGVSVDELADALWGERLPAGCASTIRTYVFHLRQALEPERVRGETGRLLVTDHGRYRLLSNGAIDADRFEQATTAGLRLLADGAASEAAAELDRGLRLWRGEVLSDLAGYDFIAPLAARLTDRRLTAVEAKVDAELALGRHSAVLPELEELIARYPLRERLHAQRMVALYRSGRASDALASYGQLRHHLADELGADPSPPLQRLHQQLLIHDPVLQIQPPSAEEVARQRSSETVRFRPHRIRRTARPRLRARWLVAGIVVAAGAAAGVGAIVVQEPQRTLAVIPPNSVAVIDASGGAMHDAIPVGQSPEGIAYGAGSVWVTNSGDNTVMRINPKTHEVIQTVLVGSNPVDIAVSDTRAWVANAGDGTVSEIDTNTSMPVGTPIPVGSLPGAIAADDNGAWVANSGDGTIQHIDARSGRAGSAVTVGEDPQGIALDGTSLWVSSAKSRVVSHLDARTGQPVGPPINVGAGAKGIAVADGSVWVANNADLTVTRIDRALGRATATMRVGDGPDAVAVGHGRVWVSDEYDGTVAEVDPTSQSVLHRYATGSSVHGMAVVGGSSVWVAAQSLSGNTHVGGTLVVGAAGLPGQFGGDLDPPTIYLNDEYAAMRPVYDSLLAYRAAGGSEGLTLVPDLATTVPEPTDGGRRYTFFVRKGIRYSDGRTVVASDFLRGLERALIVGEGYSPTDWYYGIVGGRRCHDAPRMCDLSGGVSVDDVSGRIAVQLTAPDDAFLYKFANLLVVPTPPGIPVTTLSPHRVPGTGPYQVQAFTPNKQLILTRNPYFRQWSFAAQPAGYPDRIVWSPARTTAAAVQDVLTGRADLTDLSLADTAVSDDVYRNYRDLVHRQTGFEFEWLALNVHAAPFNNRDVRRAVNYAVDRRKIVGLYGGPLQATPTCQLLMPSFPGYAPHCPYAGPNFAPDIATARTLVAHSGTLGMSIRVWAPNLGRLPPVARYLTAVLNGLGYKAQLHLVPANDTTAKFLRNPANRLQAVLFFGWSADYPAASNFFPKILSCTSRKIQGDESDNRGGYCNQQLDAVMTAAQSSAPTDPVTALDDWRKADQIAVDDAAIVPTVDRGALMLTSTRAKNLQVTPLDFITLDQMWIK